MTRQRCPQCGETDHQLCNAGQALRNDALRQQALEEWERKKMTDDDAIDMTDANGQQWTRTGRYRMALWRIDELVKQCDALARQVEVMQQAVTLANEERFKAENLAAEMAGLVREATGLLMCVGDELPADWFQRRDDWLARTAPKEATP